MGMDVYGLNPTTTAPSRPEHDDFDSEDWSNYFDAVVNETTNMFKASATDVKAKENEKTPRQAIRLKCQTSKSFIPLSKIVEALRYVSRSSSCGRDCGGVCHRNHWHFSDDRLVV